MGVGGTGRPPLAAHCRRHDACGLAQRIGLHSHTHELFGTVSLANLKRAARFHVTRAARIALAATQPTSHLQPGPHLGSTTYMLSAT